jgi:hypothetical protein
MQPEEPILGDGLPLVSILSPLSDFAALIAGYLQEIWGFLIFIGTASAFLVVLGGAILWLTNTNQKWGRSLVFTGIVLAIVVEYFILFPPSFVLP